MVISLDIFAQGELTSLREFVDQDLDTRTELASQALSLVSSLVTREDMVMVVCEKEVHFVAGTKKGASHGTSSVPHLQARPLPPP